MEKPGKETKEGEELVVEWYVELTLVRGGRGIHIAPRPMGELRACLSPVR